MDVIAKARELGKEIQADERYVAYMEAKNKSDNDEKLQEMINQFNLLRMNLSTEINKGADADENKKADLDKQIRDLYANIMSNEHMAAYAAAKEELDDVIKKVSTIIMMSANGEDPETCDVEHSCGGNCSSCGGCH